MQSLSFEKIDIRSIFPESLQLLEKFNENIKHDHEELIQSRIELMEYLRQARPQLYHIMRDCLRLDPNTR